MNLTCHMKLPWMLPERCKQFRFGGIVYHPWYHPWYRARAIRDEWTRTEMYGRVQIGQSPTEFHETMLDNTHYTNTCYTCDCLQLNATLNSTHRGLRQPLLMPSRRAGRGQGSRATSAEKFSRRSRQGLGLAPVLLSAASRVAALLVGVRVAIEVASF